MRNVTPQTGDLLCRVGGIRSIDRMSCAWVSLARDQGQMRGSFYVLGRQQDRSREDADLVAIRHLRTFRLEAMAFEAEVVAFGAQQLCIFTAVGSVADAALAGYRVVRYVLSLEGLGLIGVAAHAYGHWIGANEAWIPAGVGIVAVGAIALCARMWEFCRGNLLPHFVVAGRAQRRNLGLGQLDLPTLGRFVANLAGLIGEGRMHVSLHQLGQLRLVRIVAVRANGARERLTFVRFNQLTVLDVVTIGTQCRNCLRQMERKFVFGWVTRLVRHVTSVAAHIEGRMPAAFFGNVNALGMAFKTKVVVLPA